MEDKVELKDALEYFALHDKLLERGKVVLHRLHEIERHKYFTHLGDWKFFERDGMYYASYSTYTGEHIDTLPIYTFIDDEQLDAYIQRKNMDAENLKQKWIEIQEAEERKKYEELKKKFEGK